MLTLPQDNYTMSIEADGYETYSETLNVTDLQMSRDLKLKKTAQVIGQTSFDGTLLKTKGYQDNVITDIILEAHITVSFYGTYAY